MAGFISDNWKIKVMGLRDQFSTGFSLLKSSLRFVSHEKDLVVYPILNAVAYFMILLFMGGTVLGLFLGLESLGIDLEETAPILVEFGVYGLLFVFYALSATATTFFSSALVYCSIERFRGEKAGIMDGLKQSWAKKNSIIKFGLVSALVGTLLKIIEKKFKNAGKLLSFLGNTAWNIATFFIVPIIMYSGDESVRKMIKDSTLTFKNLWGESATARLGVEFVLLALLILISIPFFIVWILAPSLTLIIAGIYGLILMISLAFFQVSVAVIKSSLYMYAMTGKMPQDFKGVNTDDLVEREE